MAQELHIHSIIVLYGIVPVLYCCIVISSMERPKRNALKKWDDDFISTPHSHTSSSVGYVFINFSTD